MGKHSSHSLLPLFPGAVRFAKGRWWALCFAHEDERRSLLLSKNDHGWRYHCYVCGADGDALDVLIKRDEMTYAQALESLTSQTSCSLGRDAAGSQPHGSPAWRGGASALLGQLHTYPAEKWLAICDSCGLEEVRVRDVEHLTELTDRCDDSWEIAPDGAGAIGPVCLRLRGLAA